MLEAPPPTHRQSQTKVLLQRPQMQWSHPEVSLLPARSCAAFFERKAPAQPPAIPGLKARVPRATHAMAIGTAIDAPSSSSFPKEMESRARPRLCQPDPDASSRLSPAKLCSTGERLRRRNKLSRPSLTRNWEIWTWAVQTIVTIIALMLYKQCSSSSAWDSCTDFGKD